ncbi:MAG: four helix bundle protein [Myxococcales bacterium]|nr:four helix bundle protein [Myxococcales bacterium]
MRNSLHKLDAYVIGRQFLVELDKALLNAPRSRDVTQAKDAAASVLRNIAEANVTTGADRARRFQLALNEASECTACLDILELRGALAREQLDSLYELNDRQCATLWPLSRKR